MRQEARVAGAPPGRGHQRNRRWRPLRAVIESASSERCNLRSTGGVRTWLIPRDKDNPI